MTITKPSTTKDVATTPDLTDTATSAGPTLQDRVDQIGELSDPAALADIKGPKYVRVKSPAGFVSDVPEDIVESLVESGYSKTK